MGCLYLFCSCRPSCTDRPDRLIGNDQFVIRQIDPFKLGKKMGHHSIIPRLSDRKTLTDTVDDLKPLLFEKSEFLSHLLLCLTQDIPPLTVSDEYRFDTELLKLFKTDLSGICTVVRRVGVLSTDCCLPLISVQCCCRREDIDPILRFFCCQFFIQHFNIAFGRGTGVVHFKVGCKDHMVPF